MPSESRGVIVEGTYDEPVFKALIRKICGPGVKLFLKPAGGVAQIMKLLPMLLRAFEHITDEGGPVDRALAIRDAGLKDPDEIERRMLATLGNRTFIFPKGVAVHAIPGETKTWLLADISSIKTIAAARGGSPDRVTSPAGQLETLSDPKAVFQDLLARAGLPYTPAVCGDIAAEADLAILHAYFNSFRKFEEKVRA
jgi:hypothetical protein